MSKNTKELIIPKLKSLLPPNYSAIIAEKINNVVSNRQVQNVINGSQADHHGIIKIAIKMALDEKKKKELLNKKISQL